MPKKSNVNNYLLFSKIFSKRSNIIFVEGMLILSFTV